MQLVLIIALIFALYLRTYNYKYVIDDYVKRQFYPHPHPTPVEPEFYQTQPTWYYRMFVISMHAVNTTIIYLLWGWESALLFAVHPMSVWGTAWITGNYYATTLFFMLVSHYIVTTFPNIFGSVVSAGIFWGALNSTYDCLSFPFLYLFNGNLWGLSMLIPLVIFLNGKRFKAGYGCRVAIPIGKKENIVSLNPLRLVLMIKVVARYIFTSFVPMKVYFFNKWGEHNRDHQDIYDELHKPDSLLISSLFLCLTMFWVGINIDVQMTMWLFLVFTLHSQFNLIGQFFAQRYIYIALPAVCVLAAKLLAPFPYLIIFIAGWLAMKTHSVIPNWSNQEQLLLNELNMNPDRGNTHSLLAQYYMHKQELSKYPRWMINRISMLIRRSVEIDKRSWESHMNLAAFLSMIGRVDEAIRETQITIDLLEKVTTDTQKGALERLKAQKIRLENILVEAKRQFDKNGKIIVR